VTFVVYSTFDIPSTFPRHFRISGKLNNNSDATVSQKVNRHIPASSFFGSSGSGRFSYEVSFCMYVSYLTWYIGLVFLSRFLCFHSAGLVGDERCAVQQILGLLRTRFSGWEGF
jgi:hypothetical protein